MLLLRGILLGLGAAAPIGPVNVEIARRTLRYGLAAGFFTGLGAVTVDVFYAILASFGVRLLLGQRVFYWILAVAGIILLSYLGITCLARGIRDFRRGVGRDLSENESVRPEWSARTAYITGLLMTLLNPMTIAFWFVAVPGALGTPTSQPQRDLPMICAGVFLGTLSWVAGFSSAVSLAASRFGSRAKLLPLADVIGGGILIVFAALAMWNSIDPLL